MQHSNGSHPHDKGHAHRQNGGGPRSVVKELHRLDMHVGRALHQSAVHQEMETITGGNLRILRFLCIHQDRDIYQKDLEAEFGFTRSTASRVLGLMEQKGLIDRLNVHSDKRLKKLVLTEKALRLDREFRKNGDAMNARLLSGFSPEEQAALFDYLDRMLANIRE